MTVQSERIHFLRKISKTAGSLQIRLPKDVIKIYGLKSGMYVDVEMKVVKNSGK